MNNSAPKLRYFVAYLPAIQATVFRSSSSRTYTSVSFNESRGITFSAGKPSAKGFRVVETDKTSFAKLVAANEVRVRNAAQKKVLDDAKLVEMGLMYQIKPNYNAEYDNYVKCNVLSALNTWEVVA